MKKPNPIPNSKPFKKGQSGNPNGRPKKLPELDKLLSKVLGESEGESKSGFEEIIDALKAQAKKGNVRAAEVLLDRGYGKVKQDVGITGNIDFTKNEISIG